MNVRMSGPDGCTSLLGAIAAFTHRSPGCADARAGAKRLGPSRTGVGDNRMPSEVERKLDSGGFSRRWRGAGSRFLGMVRHFIMDSLFAVVVLLNAAIVGISAEWSPDWSGWIIVDGLFAAYFLIELLLNLRFLGCHHYFCGVRGIGRLFAVLRRRGQAYETLCGATNKRAHGRAKAHRHALPCEVLFVARAASKSERRHFDARCFHGWAVSSAYFGCTVSKSAVPFPGNHADGEGPSLETYGGLKTVIAWRGHKKCRQESGSVCVCVLPPEAWGGGRPRAGDVRMSGCRPHDRLEPKQCPTSPCTTATLVAHMIVTRFGSAFSAKCHGVPLQGGAIVRHVLIC